MSSTELTLFATDLRARLADVDVPVPDLDALVQSANRIAALLDADPALVTEAQWRDAVAGWDAARSAVLTALGRATLGQLAAIPGLKEKIGDADELARTGLKLDVDIGPVHLAISTAVLYVDPPDIPGVDLPPVAIGPFRVGAVEAAIVGTGGGSPTAGGGSIVRLPKTGGVEKGWGGRLSIPVPPVLVTASAILDVDRSDPSFLAVLGVQFLPPIQLSFGFSLDRVGGIVGVNRGMSTDHLTAAVRTGAGGDALFQARPPSDPASFAVALDSMFPRRTGSHIFGPSLRISWLSFGPAGSLVSVDLAVVVQLPEGRVAILGVAKLAIPSLPQVLQLRLDMLGVIDPVEQLVTIDASLVDSHILGVFQIYGDAALRMSWGSQSYVVVSIGGFFPGFDPKPARLPALRRAGMSQSVGGPLTMRVEGYFATTSNTVQFGGRIEAGFELGISAHGFIEVDAIVQFRPFRFQARIAAGFSVSVEGFDFASVHLSGEITGPGPVVVRGSLSISVFLFEFSWDETFTLGGGSPDSLPVSRPLIDVVADELAVPGSLRAAQSADPQVVLDPRPATPGVALVPPTGALIAQQRKAPLGLPIDRVECVPLPSRQGVRIAGSGADILDGFAPATFLNLTDAELVNRPPFDDLPAGRVLTPADPALDGFPSATEERTIEQIVIDTRTGVPVRLGGGLLLDQAFSSRLVEAARAEPAISDSSPVVTAVRETWTDVRTGATYASATAAHEHARDQRSAAVAAADLIAPATLSAVI